MALDLRIRRGRRRSAPTSGPDTASGGGLTVRVGGVNQSAYLMANSLVMRLNSFDFALRDPAVAPVIGNMVYALEPAWDGQVVSISHSDLEGNASKIYKVTATNAKTTTVSAAPFGLSDVPDDITTFSYRNLSITTSRTDNGVVSRGRCTVDLQGLWPGMTFALTSANHGLVAQQFSVSNATVTWLLKDHPVYAIEFGDAVLGLTQLPVDTGGVTIDSSGMNLRDPFGTLIFNSGSGFGAAWRRFLLSGVYNGDFAAGPATPSWVIDNAINPLPYWYFARVGGTGVNFQWAGSPVTASGGVLQIQMVAGVADDNSFIEQIIPVNGASGQNYAYAPKANSINATTSDVNTRWYLECQYLRADGITPTGASATSSQPVSVSFLSVTTTNGTGAVPVDAYFLRVRIGLKRDTAAVGATASLSLTEIRCPAFSEMFAVVDTSAPTTYYPADLAQVNGNAYFRSRDVAFTRGPTIYIAGGVTPPYIQFFDNIGAPTYGGLHLKFDPQGAIATRTSTQSITTATWTAIDFTATDISDPFGFHDPASNSTRFTVPTGWGGTYLCVFTSSFASGSATGSRYVGWGTNGANPPDNRSTGGHTQPSGTVVRLVSAVTLELAAGDYVQAMVFQDTGGNLNTGATTEAAVYYIGENV